MTFYLRLLNVLFLLSSITLSDIGNASGIPTEGRERPAFNDARQVVAGFLGMDAAPARDFKILSDVRGGISTLLLFSVAPEPITASPLQ